MSTRHRLLALLAVAGTAAIVVVVVLLAGSSHSRGSSGSTRASAGAATVERHNLVLSDTESGTVSYSNPQTVYDRLSGTITWLPAVGARISPGQPLFRVDGQPVLLMNGGAPAYRTLSASDTSGPDVLELNRNLIALGFGADALVADDEWQAGTTAGIDALQASLGEEQTGALPLGQIVFLPGDQLVSAQEVTVGSSGTGGNSAPQPASLIDPPAAPEFVGLDTPIATPPATRHGKAKRRHRKKHLTRAEEIAELIAALKAESAALKAARSEPASASSHSSASNHSGSHGTASHAGGSSSGAGAGGGDAAAAGVAVLQTTSTHLIVTVELPASSQSEAKVHEHVGVELPDGSTVPGTITAVSAVAASSGSSGSGSGSSGASGAGSGSGGSGAGGSGSGSASTIPVTIALRGHYPRTGLDEAAVSVNFVQQKARNVLSVPVTALLATSGNSYAVQESEPPHRLIPVTTGLFAAGYVEISGAGIRPGLQVTDSQG